MRYVDSEDYDKNRLKRFDEKYVNIVYGESLKV